MKPNLNLFKSAFQYGWIVSQITVRAKILKTAILSALISAFAFLLISCAPTMETSQPNELTSEHAATAEETQFPNVELTAELLSDLLQIEFSQHRGTADQTIDTLYQIAVDTQDARLAELATLRAINLQRTDISKKATKLWVDLAPDFAPAWLSRLLVQIENKQFEDAALSFAKVMQLSNDQGIKAANRIARVLSGSLEPNRAFEVFSNFAAGVPDNLDVQVQLINLAISVQIDSAEIDLLIENILENEPAFEGAAAAKFRLYLETDRAEEGIDFAVEFLRKYPQSHGLREIYAIYLTQNNHYREAVQEYEQLPGAEALFQLGLLHEAANRLDLAKEKFLAYHELVPDDQRAVVNLARVNIDLKLLDEAAEWIHKIISNRYAFEKIALSAVLISARGDLETATKLLRSQQPQNDHQQIRIYLMLSDLYQDDGQLDKALKLMNEALKAFPGNTRLLLTRSFIAAELKQIDLVERDIDTLLAKQPDNPMALNALGYTLADQTDRFDEAFELIQQALELRPNDPYILDSMGWVHYKLGDYELALKFLKNSIERRYDPVTAAHLGEVYWVIGNKREARKIWKQAVKLNPDDKILIDTIEKFTN